MLNLDQVTLFCVDTRTPDLSIWAMQQCLQKAHFKDAILVTDTAKAIKVPDSIRIIAAPPIHSINDYSLYLQSDLSTYIQGTHMLVMQWDSFITNPQLWNDQFIEYDYIGAPWPHHPETPVGNGGFSLRSKKLFTALQNPLYQKSHPEDQSICIFNKDVLKDLGILIAPKEVAEQFAFEREFKQAFGFHGFFNFAKVLSRSTLQHILEIIPNELLGKIDTYDLIDDLISSQRELANLLLVRSEPKGKLWKKHLKLRMKLLFTQTKAVSKTTL
jgi:hypothetical protein